MTQDIFKYLNNEQIEAVKNTEGYIRLIAGAGTGKTRTLTHRYAYLVEELNINPSNILNMTFTNKAANEMKERILKLTKNHSYNYNFISTFHSFCSYFLRKEISFIGWDNNFTIIDEGEKKSIIRDIVKGLNMDKSAIDESLTILEEFKISTDYIEIFINSNFKNIKNKVLEHYLIRQKRDFLLEYDDLINFTLYILKKNKDICEKWQTILQYIQVDEFQDTDDKQLELVKILSEKHKNLFVVGDSDQLIYSWRGAKNHIYTFDKNFPNCKTLYLLNNYRSTTNIIKVANNLIKYNRERVFKELLSLQEEGSPPTYYEAIDTKDEAKWIAKNINLLLQNNQHSDIAVMYRLNNISRSIEECLISENIPYIIHGGTEFYARVEIKDVIACLKLLTKDDDMSLMRIIKTLRLGIGDTKIDFLQQYANTYNISIYQALVENCKNNSSFIRAGTFINTINKFRQIVLFGSNISNNLLEETKGNIIELFDVFLNELGYLKYITEKDEKDGKMIENKRIDNINEFKRSMIEYKEKRDGFILNEFLQEISLITEKNNQNDNFGKVQLMTIHKAKGLEFKNVFVCGLNEGIIPSARSMNNFLQMEEERRIMYVAITRAKTNLFLSSAGGFSYEGKPKVSSRFLNEMNFESNDNEGDKNDKSNKNFIKDISDFKVGNRISHKKFGDGTVIGVENNLCDVVFDNDIENIKTIIDRFLVIKKD